MPLTLLTSERFVEHRPPEGHPESPARARVMQEVAAQYLARGGLVEDAPAADEAALARVHQASYVDYVLNLTGRTDVLDADTHISPRTVDAARHAAGAAIRAVDLALDKGPNARAVALVRPPGHHAEPARAMGFCLFNNVSVAAAHARARGLRRVAIIDYDVHHGNGTQAAFYDDPSVLYVSSHQYPFYPGTGDSIEIGQGSGAGFTVNIPLPAGTTTADYEAVYASVVVPIVLQFCPELILVSAGFDAHEDDPLGGMSVSTAGFGRLTAMLAVAADVTCEGRLVVVTEGGYSLPALASSLGSVIDALSDGRAAEILPTSRGSTSRAEYAHMQATEHLTSYWQL